MRNRRKKTETRGEGEERGRGIEVRKTTGRTEGDRGGLTRRRKIRRSRNLEEGKRRKEGGRSGQKEGEEEKEEEDEDEWKEE